MRLMRSIKLKKFKLKTSLSIIVPIYNVEKFLHKCLDSIIQSEWDDILYEIIIVNDSSPDGSLHIANNYAKEYNFITVISQDNKGLGGARNTGIRNANGDYILFLDSDDFLLPDKLHIVVKTTIKNRLDIMEFGAVRVDGEYKVIDEIFHKNDISSIDGITYAEKYNFENSVCNKIYNRNFLLANNLQFFERTFIEDAPFNSEAYFKAHSVASMKIVPIAFYQNINSITRKKREGLILKKFIADSIKVTSKIESITASILSLNSNSFYKRKVAIFTSGTLLMILRSGFSKEEKYSYISALKNCNLYPVKNYTGIIIRDVFIFFTNKNFFLQILLRLLK